MKNEEMAELLWRLIYAEYSLSLGGGEAHRAAFQCARRKSPGTLIIETSTAYRRPEKLECVGWLVAVEMEPFPGDWEGEPPPVEQVFYLELLDGRLARWTNADFVAAFSSASLSEYVPLGTRDAAWVAAARDRHAALIAARRGSPSP